MLTTTLLEINIIFVLILTINSTSWTDKHNERTYNVESIDTNKVYNDEPVEDECRDKRSNCKLLKHKCSKRIVKNLCKDTCGGCRAELPVDCSLTKFGCCWDNITIAKGPNNKGCAICADKYYECMHFKDQCYHHQMRMICPVTCGVRCQQCEDNKYQAIVCPMYKQYKFCEISPGLMQKMCAKTCGFCAS